MRRVAQQRDRRVVLPRVRHGEDEERTVDERAVVVGEDLPHARRPAGEGVEQAGADAGGVIGVQPRCGDPVDGQALHDVDEDASVAVALAEDGAVAVAGPRAPLADELGDLGMPDVGVLEAGLDERDAGVPRLRGGHGRSHPREAGRASSTRSRRTC